MGQRALAILENKNPKTKKDGLKTLCVEMYLVHFLL